MKKGLIYILLGQGFTAFSLTQPAHEWAPYWCAGAVLIIIGSVEGTFALIDLHKKTFPPRPTHNVGNTFEDCRDTTNDLTNEKIFYPKP